MVSSSVLGIVTTVHLALAMLRNHRSVSSAPVSMLAAVSLLFAAAPWFLPSAIGLAIGVAAHLAWYYACEILVPKPRATERRREQPSAPRPRPEAAALAPASTAPQRPKGFVQAPVLVTFNETPDIKTIRLARPQGFEFEAGQFIAVRIRVDGKDCSRCYSISSAPDVAGYLEISVKRQGSVSNALHATARPGALLSIRSPNGAFKYPSGDDRPIVLLAGGVGITPLMSMLRHAIQTEPSRPITLLYSARSEADFAFRDELAALARRHPQVRVLLASSRSSSPEIYPGRIDAELIRTTVPEVAHSVCFTCGPASMIDQVKALLAGLGVPAPQIHHEVFEAAIAASASREEPIATPVSAQRAVLGSHHMKCQRSGKTVPIVRGQTLLEAAETGGIALESLCRAGICGTCRVRVTDGDVECTTDALSADEQASGFVLACVATARASCALDL
jgi:ferredoxin-NADP reductase